MMLFDLILYVILSILQMTKIILSKLHNFPKTKNEIKNLTDSKLRPLHYWEFSHPE